MEREKQLCANVDLYAAPVFWLLGFPPGLNTPLFAAARVAGWCAHVIEQHDHNRLIRPRSLYTGPPRRPFRRDLAAEPRTPASDAHPGDAAAPSPIPQPQGHESADSAPTAK